MAFIVDEILKSMGEKIVARIKDDILNKKVTKYGSVNASGSLYDSVYYVVHESSLQIWAWDYAYYLEFGRKPGKFPPRNVIVEWIKAKNLTYNIPINSLAFLIQRKIAQKGTTIFEQGGSDLFSDIINENLINEFKSELFEAIIDSAVESFGSNVLKLAA